MTNEQQSVRYWMKDYGQATPEQPCIPSPEIRKLRAKLILEEAIETVKALGFRLDDDDQLLADFFRLSSPCEPDLEQIADGCEDIKVVTEGTLIACGLIKLDSTEDPLFNEVMQSNCSKFWTKKEKEIYESNVANPWLEFIPTDTLCDEFIAKDGSGKVIKSPSYKAPNLQPIIDKMSN